MTTTPPVQRKRATRLDARAAATKTSRSRPGKADKSSRSLAGAKKLAGAEGTGSTATPDFTSLPIRWQIFIEEYLIDFNGAQACIRAGFAPSDAADRACRLLKRPEIRLIVEGRLEDRIEAIRMTRERVLDAFADMAEADANELCELRRVCCRHCHGESSDHAQAGAVAGARAYQITPFEFMQERGQWDARRAEALANKKPDIGDFPRKPGNWYDRRKPIDPECPECFGDGLQLVFLKDTRTISKRARALFGGVKETRDGIEIRMHSKEAALSVLAKHHKLFDEAPVVNLDLVSSADLDEIYARGVAAADNNRAAAQQRATRMRTATLVKEG